MESIYRVISSDLPPDKCWYALNVSICGIAPKTFVGRGFATKYPEHFQEVKLDALKTLDDCAVSPKAFQTRGNKRGGYGGKEKVFVASSFGVLGAILRQTDIALPLSEALSKLDLNKLTFELQPCVTPQLQSFTQGEQEQQTPKEIKARKSLLFSVPLTPISPQGKGDQENETEASALVDHTRASQESQTYRSTVTCTSPNIQEIKDNKDLLTPERNSMAKKRAKKVFSSITEVCEEHRESIVTVLGTMCATDDEIAEACVADIVDFVASVKGVKKTFSELVSGETLLNFIGTMRVPDWVLLYLKLKARLSDEGWQMVLNLTNCGRTGKQTDTPLLLTKNCMKTIKSTFFTIVRGIFGLGKVPAPLQGYQVDLLPVIEWTSREMRLHQLNRSRLKINIKLDGRPFWGRSQVMVGIVPVESCNSAQSDQSVLPLAIANCMENRENLKLLLRDINSQKAIINNNGMTVDGKHYDVEFVVTLDYKALLLLLVKKDESEFELGGRGVGVEFCLFCTAVRGCKDHGADHNEVCTSCLRKKMNIGSFKGIRDDLEFLMEEEISSVMLCGLHMEMRNTEQLLASIGLMSYKIGSLNKCNDVLREYGPETFEKDRISVNPKVGQETAVGRHNVHVASMSGPTERAILDNIEMIVEASLPSKAMESYYSDKKPALLVLLNKYSFCNNMEIVN